MEFVMVDSSIARYTDAGSYTHAGPEIGLLLQSIYSSINNFIINCNQIR
jgi:glucosamine 6-phosphate synthetase-like amidotransferase/phosphosugar isomerase protein